MNRIPDENAAVEIHIDLDVGRAGSCAVRRGGSFTAFADRDRVGAVLLFDPDADARLAVHDGRVPDVVEAVLHARHIADADVRVVDGFAAPLFDLDGADGLGRHAFAHGADIEFVARIFEVTGGLFDLLGLKRGLDVEDGQLQRLELVVVDPDAQVALLVTRQRDLANAGQNLELIGYVQLEIFGQRVDVALGGRCAEQENRLVLRIALDDCRSIGAQGQFHATQLRLHLGQRRVDVAVDLEFERDRGLALLDLRGHSADALGRKNLLLDLVDDLGFHDFRCGAAPRRVDR